MVLKILNLNSARWLNGGHIITCVKIIHFIYLGQLISQEYVSIICVCFNFTIELFEFGKHDNLVEKKNKNNYNKHRRTITFTYTSQTWIIVLYLIINNYLTGK